MFNIVIFGGPGSGKGTQSERLIKEYGMHHISTGDVLRAQIAAGTEYGKTADSYISKGQLIPDELMIDILANELETHPEEVGRGVIFDGFPRTIPQAEALKEMLAKKGMDIDAVIGLEVPDEELMQRLVKRGADSGRSDDNPETISKRLEVYHSLTQPLKEFYQGHGTYCPIHGLGTIDEIFGRIKDAVDSRKNNK